MNERMVLAVVSSSVQPTYADDASVLFFFNMHKSPRHNALRVCMYGVSSRPALAGGVCMYVLNRPERRGRPADSAMMADAAGRPPPGLGPRRSGFRHVGGRSSFGPFSPVAYSC